MLTLALKRKYLFSFSFAKAEVVTFLKLSEHNLRPSF